MNYCERHVLTHRMFGNIRFPLGSHSQYHFFFHFPVWSCWIFVRNTSIQDKMEVQIVKAVTFCGAYLIETFLLWVCSAFACLIVFYISICRSLHCLSSSFQSARNGTMRINFAHSKIKTTKAKRVKDKSGFKLSFAAFYYHFEIYIFRRLSSTELVFFVSKTLLGVCDF